MSFVLGSGPWLALALVVLACSERTPHERSRRPVRELPAKTEPAVAAQPEIADDGLVAIDGARLLDRIRKSGRKGTLVNVWASWCGSCKRELPMLAQLASALTTEGLDLMLVSVDEPNARAAAAQLWAGLTPKPSAPAFIVEGSLAPFKRALNPAWKGAIPSTFLFDADAQLRYFWPGPVLEHEITTILSAFLAGRELEGPTYVEPDPPPG